jgi:sugar phosphate isomerase/epimerase
MKLGISTYTYAWAIGFAGAVPSRPLTALQLLDKAQELGVGLVQFGPNLPLDKLPDAERREVIKRADAWRIDLEMATCGLGTASLRQQIQFAKRMGVILLKTTPDCTRGKTPMRLEMASQLRAITSDLAEGEIRLAIDNSHIPAQELNELLNPIGSPWIGVALDTVNPLAIPQGWQMAVRVLAHRTLSVQIKDFVVEPAWHNMGFTVEGRPAGKGQLNVPWLVESFAALRVAPSTILESWTPQQKTLQETIALEEAWAKQSVEYMRRFIPD